MVNQFRVDVALINGVDVLADTMLDKEMPRILTEPLSSQNWKTQIHTLGHQVLCLHVICTQANEHQSSVEQKAEMLSGWLPKHPDVPNR